MPYGGLVRRFKESLWRLPLTRAERTMRNLINDVLAYGLRLKRCSCAQLAERGVELLALGNRLEEAWRGSDTNGVGSLRVQLCRLARETAAELARSVDVTFHSVSKTQDAGWVLIFGTAEVQPVPLRPQQFVWIAEAACAA